MYAPKTLTTLEIKLNVQRAFHPTLRLGDSKKQRLAYILPGIYARNFSKYMQPFLNFYPNQRSNLELPGIIFSFHFSYPHSVLELLEVLKQAN